VILTVLEAELGSPSSETLEPRVLAFEPHKPRLKRSSITQDIVKHLMRGRTVTVQYLDSNGWTVTVQCLDSNDSRQ
jgi:hypothetical protein